VQCVVSVQGAESRVCEERMIVCPEIDYCNSPLNNKNTDNHFPWFFPSLGFHINHCVNCVFVVLGLMHV
jgi:hypothetical protein